MAERAHVTSVEAIETFRSHLIVYLGKARPAVEEVTADMQRMRMWIENDQRNHWEGELRRRNKELEQATAELFSAKLSKLSKATAVQQLAVHRAKRSADEATEKLRVLKRWSRDFEGRVQPLVKQMEKLHTVFTHDMVKALAYLAEAVKILSAYAVVAPPSSATGPATTTPGAAADAESIAGEKAEARPDK